MILETDGDTYSFLVRRLAGGEQDGGCDGCVRRHSFSNVKCAMNLSAHRRYERCFYDLVTRKPIPGVWKQTDSSWQNSNMGLETWRRIAPIASTPSKAQLLASV